MKMAISDLRIVPPFRDLFPVQTSLVQRIAADMRKRGYDEAHPVLLWQGHKRTVLDGRTRIEAAKEAGLFDVPVVTVECRDEHDAIAYAIRCQRNRRNLTDAEIARCVEALDKRKHHGGDRRTKGPSGPMKQGRSANATAASVGTSPNKVKKLRALADHAPDLMALVTAGELSLNAGYTAWRKRQKKAGNPAGGGVTGDSTAESPQLDHAAPELATVASSPGLGGGPSVVPLTAEERAREFCRGVVTQWNGRPKDEWQAVADILSGVVAAIQRACGSAR